MRLLQNNLLLQFIPFRLLLGYVMGILFQHYFAFELNIKHLYVLLWLCVVLFLLLFRKANLLIPLIFCFLIGILHTYKHQKHIKTIAPLLSQKHSLWLEITKKPKRGKKNFQAILRQIDKKPTDYKVYLYLKDPEKTLQIGDWIYTESFLNPITNFPKSNFDFKSYSHQSGFVAQCFVKKFKKIPARYHDMNTYFLMFRESIKQKLEHTNLSEQVKNFISASLLGDRGTLPQKTINAYTNAGVIHLLAVSGLHTGIIWGLFFVLLYPLRLIKRNGFVLQNIVALCFLWAYALITGCQPPVMRAATLYTCIGLALIYGSSYRIHFAIWVAALVCLWFEPYLLFSVSFQMSYAAVLSITYLNPLLSSFLKVTNPIARYIWGLITVCLAAQIGILPLSLYYFGKIPLLFLFSNIVIIPLFTVILLSSSFVVLLAMCKILPSFLEIFLNTLTKYLHQLISTYASYENLIVENLKINNVGGVFLLYGILIILYFQIQRIRNLYILKL